MVRNGQISTVELPFELTMEKSGWFLVRALSDVKETFRFASTAPWYVEVGGQPMSAQREAASFFLAWARKRSDMVQRALETLQQRTEVAAAHEKAISYWENVVAGAE